MDEKNYLAACYAFLPFGPARLGLLRKYFGSARKVWDAPAKKLNEVGLSKKHVAAFVKHRENFDLISYFQRLEDLKIKFVTIDEDNYPRNLKDLQNAPLVLYFLGNIKLADENAVAIVGTRKMTSYGREVASKFSSELGTLGVTIVSGLALGIDAIAHKGCLDVGGRSLAVLASGLDTISPRSNLWLAKKILDEGLGAIISEYPLGTQPLRSFFANRNRIISGLSKAVIVVEGRQKSGTLLTANAAAEQGRTVFAVPGQITSPMSEAPHYLMKNGAVAAYSANDILTELNMQLQVDREQIEKVLPSTKEEGKLLKLLENEPLHMDEISRKLKMDVNKVSSMLTMLELKGFVKNIESGVYKVN